MIFERLKIIKLLLLLWYHISVIITILTQSLTIIFDQSFVKKSFKEMEPNSHLSYEKKTMRAEAVFLQIIILGMKEKNFTHWEVQLYAHASTE